MRKILLNCDLGEWEGASFTASLMPHLHMANIACGGHAGSVDTIKRCAALAAKNGVLTGAHPGISGAQGRKLPADFGLDDFSDLLEQQIAYYLTTGTSLHHIKLHGALYHLSESDSAIRQIFLDFAADQKCAIIALAGGAVATAATAMGIPVFQEAFLDRNYLPNGTLVPRTEPNAQVKDLTQIKKRILEYHQKTSPIQPDTFCIHSDTPTSLAIAQTARQMLDQLGPV